MTDPNDQLQQLQRSMRRMRMGLVAMARLRPPEALDPLVGNDRVQSIRDSTERRREL